MAVRRSFVVTRLADERAGDDASHGVTPGQDLSRHTAPFVELLERDRVLVGRNLEDRVGGGVHDPLPRLLVLLAELLDDLRAGSGLVSEHPAPRPVHERIDHLVRKAVRVGRKRRRGDDPHHLPVPRRGVLPLGALDEPPGDSGSSRLRRASLERHDVPEPERLQVGQVEAADCACDVAERVRALVAVIGGVRQLPRPDGVEDDHARTGHLWGRRGSAREYVAWHGAILRRLWTGPSDSSCSRCTSPPSSAWPDW